MPFSNCAKKGGGFWPSSFPRTKSATTLGTFQVISRRSSSLPWPTLFTAPRSEKNSNACWRRAGLQWKREYFLALLFVGLLATRLCHVDLVWVEEGYPTAAAIQLLDGKALYRDVWFDKPPGSPYLYLLWGAHIGWPLRVAGAVYIWLCCLMAWCFARNIWGEREGTAAAMLLGFFLTFGIPSAVIALAPDLLMVLPHL